MGTRTDAPGTYPVDPWILREEGFDPAMLPRSESAFALANGWLGLRGGLEEGAGNHADGTFLAGFFEEDPIVYGEVACGYARNRQVMMNVAGGKGIRLWVGGEPLDLRTGEVLAHARSLDLREGVLVRRLRWRSPGGAVVEVASRRLVALGRGAVAAIEYAAERLEGEGELRVESALDGAARNQAGGSDPRIGVTLREGGLDVVHAEGAGTAGLLVQATRRSGLTLACAVDHELAEGVGAEGARAEAGPDRVTVHLRAPRALRFTKYLAYATSRDHPAEELPARARALLAASRVGFDQLAAEQRAHLAAWWRDADVELQGDPAVQQGIRFALFHLLQAASPDPRTSVGAKGLTGEGYDGHYFWDTELYVAPVFTYTQPERAEVLLRYRIGTLDRARERAAEMSQRGALFAWRTLDGRECSAYYPASTAQYHIDADIAYALRRHVRATGDRALLHDAAELVLETARLWADLGHFAPARGGAFCIDEVTGPDEYSALVNNNLYTNLMAREHLRWAVQVAGELRAEAPDRWARLCRRIELDEAEVEGWRRAAEAMHLPYDRERGIHAQDDAFLARKVWDFGDARKHRPALLLHHHPLVIYRHQVLKQPDVVLAQVLLGDQVNLADKRRNFGYYDPLTTGDSSLSACVQAIAACELGELELAQAYFHRTVRMDLDDVLHKSAAGLHLAALGGTWLAIVQGFAGMRDHGGQLSFSPRLPAHWERLRFRLRLGGRRLEVAVTQGEASYRLLEGAPLAIRHRGRALELAGTAPVTASLAPSLRAVVFDLDGVLARTAELHYQAWARLAREEGWPFDRRVNERLKGVSRRESLAIILEHAGAVRPEEEQARLAARKNGYYRELIERLTPADLLPGARELLAELRAAGIRTAIASVSHNVFTLADRLGLREAVDLIVDPAHVVKGKPDPEIFLRAAEALGVPPEDCAGVEDARAGVAAIRAARMLAVGVGEGLDGADWQVAGVEALRGGALQERFGAGGGMRMVG